MPSLCLCPVFVLTVSVGLASRAAVKSPLWNEIAPVKLNQSTLFIYLFIAPLCSCRKVICWGGAIRRLFVTLLGCSFIFFPTSIFSRLHIDLRSRMSTASSSCACAVGSRIKPSVQTPHVCHRHHQAAPVTHCVSLN